MNPEATAHHTGKRTWFQSVLAGLALALLALLAACSKEEAKTKSVELANDSVKWLTGLDPKKDFGEIRQEFIELKRTLDRQDFEGLRQACLALDQKYNRRILGWYAAILLREHTEGVKSAQAEIARLKGLPDLQPNERAALVEIGTYYSQKGNVSTARLALIAYAFYLECQTSHSSWPVQLVLELTASKAEREEIQRFFEAASGTAQEMPPAPPNAEPNREANGSQPIRSGTNSTSAPAGSRR